MFQTCFELRDHDLPFFLPCLLLVFLFRFSFIFPPPIYSCPALLALFSASTSLFHLHLLVALLVPYIFSVSEFNFFSPFFFLFRTTSIVIFVDNESKDTFVINHSITQPITSEYTRTIPQVSLLTHGQVAGACCTNLEQLIQLWVVIFLQWLLNCRQGVISGWWNGRNRRRCVAEWWRISFAHVCKARLLYDIRDCHVAVALRVQLYGCRKRHESFFCIQVYHFCGL